ncbi:response regulator [Pantoea agglomerans]|uniref:response regulator n=1 Tax=Enterobacter agglomerans TaxID=549 RepID=UPI0037094A65
MKLLLIEDNQKASAWVRKGLEEAGYIVDYAADGRDGLHLGLSHPYSLVILDIMLPGMDGWVAGAENPAYRQSDSGNLPDCQRLGG